MATADALAMAKAEDKDLILISYKSRPPLCKIQEIGKYKYDLIKTQRRNRKNQKSVELKEIRLGLNIDSHDVETKQKQANKFLHDGHSVKIAMRFRGREITFMNNGRSVIQSFIDGLDCDATDVPIKREGNTLSIIVKK